MNLDLETKRNISVVIFCQLAEEWTEPLGCKFSVHLQDDPSGLRVEVQKMVGKQVYKSQMVLLDEEMAQQLIWNRVLAEKIRRLNHNFNRMVEGR